MGEFSFRIPHYWEVESRHVRTVHVIGLDGIPRPCSVKLIGDQIVITRNQNESGRVFVSYPFAKQGELTVCTGTLPESENPYHFATELARGTINRLRNQTSIWEEGGLQISPEIRQLTKQAIVQLGNSIVAVETERKDVFAAEALNIAIEAIFCLSEKFGREISDFRVSETGIPPFWIATALPTVRPTSIQAKQHFDLFAIPGNFTQLDLEDINEDKIVIGPWLDASPSSTFAIKNSDFQTGRRNLLDECDAMLKMIPANASLIHAACNLNGIGHRSLSYRQQIQLTSELLNHIDDSNVELPVMVSFDYPWAERLAWSVGGIHPLQIADDLMRNGSRISFIGLDINLDYWPGGSASRDPLQWIDMIDVWCQLGIPLVLCLRVPYFATNLEPSGAVELKSDPNDNVTIISDSDMTDSSQHDSKITVFNSIRENLSDDQRLKLLRTILPMVVARPGVHGIIWRQWSDNDDLRFPNAGLVTESGTAKPTLPVFAELRSSVLKR